MKEMKKMAVDWNAEREKFESLGAGDYVKDGDIIDLTQLLEVQNKLEEYVDKTGKLIKTTRFYYIFKDKTLRVPWTVHDQVLKNQREGVTQVKVFVSGTGIGKRYQVIAVVGK